MQVLLDNNADTSITDRLLGDTALHIAAGLGDTKFIGIFLNRDLLHTVNKYGNTPMAVAAGKGNIEVLQAFLDAGLHAGSPEK